MASIQNTPNATDFLVLHPLDDVAEAKRSSDGLGPIAMTPSVRISLYVLRAYLLLMMGMLAYHVLVLAGVLRHS